MTHYLDNYNVNITVQEVVRDLWVQALRSGQYQQGRQYLKTSEGGYCCLGVLCNLGAPGDWEAHAPPSPAAYDPYPYIPSQLRVHHHSHRGAEGLPERGILELAGITEMQANYLAHRNDVDGWTFKEIADEVERGFPRMGPNGHTMEHYHLQQQAGYIAAPETPF